MLSLNNELNFMPFIFDLDEQYIILVTENNEVLCRFYICRITIEYKEKRNNAGETSLVVGFSTIILFEKVSTSTKIILTFQCVMFYYFVLKNIKNENNIISKTDLDLYYVHICNILLL